ncbi:cupin domain-containing protein [Actinomycetospora sp. CA-084318]|uniref:cupin domain-containing protein n=1 Tax=Actinomycetospora sp. CA-084318 TaxID=3239892 RepID=UPI003D97C283
MAEVSVVGPDDAERLQIGSAVTTRILEDGTTTGHRLGVAEGTIAPHTAGPPQHRHALHDEGFYVISGLLRFTVGDREYDAAPGTLVTVPPGVPHTFANPGDEPARALTTFTPASYTAYFRELAATRPDEIEDLMARYATVITEEYAP